jgi:hypothetical protein
VRGGGWIWGEASVGPTNIDVAQADFLMRALPKLGAALPMSISTIRFQEIQFSGLRELPGTFEGVARRGGDGTFTAATLKGSEGNVSLNISNPPGSEGIGVQLDASNWRATVGPAIPWNEVHASIRVRPGLIEVPEYMLVGYFGSIKGAVYAAGDVEWAVTGNAVGANLDIEAVLRQMAGIKGDLGASKAVVPASGTAGLELLLGGRGPTLNDAVDSTVAAGPLKVRWAAVNGINLGYAATRPRSQSGGGGVTRFTELTGWMSAGPAGTAFQDLVGRAGALSTRGEVAIAPDRRLSGSLRVDLGGTRVQAPLNIQVRGTLLAPEFGRSN